MCAPIRRDCKSPVSHDTFVTPRCGNSSRSHFEARVGRDRAPYVLSNLAMPVRGTKPISSLNRAPILTYVP